MNRHSGFTLLELIVTIAVLAILLGVAAPSFVSMIRSNRAASEANTVLALLTLARSEAVKRGTNVAVCASTDGESCAAGASLDQGAIVFVDADNDGAPASTNDIVQALVPLTRGSTVSGDAAISYAANGALRGATGRTLTIDPGDESNRKKVVLSATGRIRIE